MQEKSVKPPKDDYDRALVDYINKALELEKAGKLKWLSQDDVFANTKKIIKQAKIEQNKQMREAYKNQPRYAV